MKKKKEIIKQNKKIRKKEENGTQMKSGKRTKNRTRTKTTAAKNLANPTTHQTRSRRISMITKVKKKTVISLEGLGRRKMILQQST